MAPNFANPPFNDVRLRQAGFVDAARLSGHRDGALLLLQVLPNIMLIMVVQLSLTMGYAILNAAGVPSSA